MPNLGDLTKAKDIGLKGNQQLIWSACEECGKERWVQLAPPYSAKKPRGKLCKICAGRQVGISTDGSKSPCWKGGRTKNGQYIDVWISPDDFYFAMVPNGRGRYIAEHRLVMAKHLGRCLQTWEFVHHKNGIKNDNRIENLELTILGNHIAEHNQGYQDGYRKGLKDGKLKQIQDLKAYIAILENRFL